MTAKYGMQTSRKLTANIELSIRFDDMERNVLPTQLSRID